MIPRPNSNIGGQVACNASPLLNINSLLAAPFWPPPPLIAPLHWGIPKENKAPVASGGQRLLVHPTPLWGNAPEILTARWPALSEKHFACKNLYVLQNFTFLFLNICSSASTTSSSSLILKVRFVLQKPIQSLLPCFYLSLL